MILYRHGADMKRLSRHYTGMNKVTYPKVIKQTFDMGKLYILTQVTEITWSVEKRSKVNRVIRKCNTYKKAMNTYKSLALQG